ncbi:MAG: BatD family protein [bacterium]
MKVFFAFLFISSCVFAQEPEITVKVDKPIITIGDPIKYTLVIEKDNNVQITPPEIKPGNFEILNYKELKPQKTRNKILIQYEYIITTYQTGKFKIPAVIIEYILPNKEKRKIHSQEIKIEVKSVLPQNAKDIKDIKPPVEIKADLTKWIWILIIIFLILLISVIGLIYWNKRKKPPLEQEVEVIRPPHEIAYEQLNKIRTSNLLTQGLVKEYYIQISDVIRQYIERRYKINALELTTQELIEKMKINLIGQDYVNLVNNFLKECDLVKFAKYIPHKEEINTVIERAKGIIDFSVESADFTKELQEKR